MINTIESMSLIDKILFNAFSRLQPPDGFICVINNLACSILNTQIIINIINKHNTIWANFLWLTSFKDSSHSSFVSVPNVKK